MRRTVLLTLACGLALAAPAQAQVADGDGFTSSDVSSFVRAAAKAGIPTYRPGARKPVVRVKGRKSPVRLTTGLAESAALGAWAQAGMTAGQLDAMTGPLQLGDVSLPTGAMVAAWAKGTNTASARLARQILGPVDYSRYEDIVLPSAVLMLFSSDVALHLPQRKPKRGARRAVASAAAVPAGPCTAARDFVDKTINRVFDAIGHVQADHRTINRIFGSFFGKIISTAGDIASFAVNKTIDAARTIALGATRIPIKFVIDSISGVAAAVNVVGQIANGVMPWKGAHSIDRNPTSKAVGGGVPGLLTLTVTAPGSELEWPGWLQNCASVFEFPLPTTTPKNEPVTWDLSQQSPAGLVAPGTPSATLDDHGKATQPFTTGEESPQVASGPERAGRVDVLTTVRRTDLDPLVGSISGAVLRLLPSLVRDNLGTQIRGVIEPMLESLKNRINDVRNVTTRSYFTVLYHDPPDPSRQPPPPPPGVGGHWNGQWTAQGGSGTWSADFTQDGSTFSGSIVINGSACVHGGTISGTVDGDQIRFGVVEAEQQISYSGTLSGDTMSGTWSKPAGADPCTADSGTFSATRG